MTEDIKIALLAALDALENPNSKENYMKDPNAQEAVSKLRTVCAAYNIAVPPVGVKLNTYNQPNS